MKIQLASDLHLEMLGPQLKATTLIEPAPGADLLVLAGDIGSGIDAVQRFADWPVPVVYVAGNHEFYDRSWDQTRIDLRDACQASGIHFLDNGILEASGVRILGSTLWTDFRVDGYTQRKCMEEAELRINDFYRIQTQIGPLRALQTVEDHEMSRRWLQHEMAGPFKGKTIVVTHHAPHSLSIAPRYAGTALNGAFASDLSDLLGLADLWLHGHTHDPCDYTVAGCRVLSNPAGYTSKGRRARTKEELEFENPAFNPLLVIDL